jgi:mannose-6-phosphate isomerase-like protein (cupin superfamily)
MIEQLNERINNREPSYVEKGIQPTFTWETVVGYLTHCADVELGEPIGILTYRLPIADDIESIKPVKEWLSENLDKEVIGTDLYVSLSTKKGIKYSSSNDVLLWNVLGTGILTLQNDSRTINSGDLIYIPSGQEYIIKPESAQAICLFSLQ